MQKDIQQTQQGIKGESDTMMQRQSAREELPYKEIAAMRMEAQVFIDLAKSPTLIRHLGRFVQECTAKLPSHKCYVEDDDNKHIILEEYSGEKYIVIRLESEPGDVDTPDEFYEYACVKRYELKDKKEPASYNQTPPGLYHNYPYLMKLRISQATRYEILEAYLRLKQ